MHVLFREFDLQNYMIALPFAEPQAILQSLAFPQFGHGKIEALNLMVRRTRELNIDLLDSQCIVDLPRRLLVGKVIR
jgi:hypothetical protein